jgi:RHS repeat-associated protein
VGGTQNEFLYCGEQLDPNLGFYYLRARWMNAGNGRFQTMDGYEGTLSRPATTHKYMYANMDPTNFRDPSGNDGIDDLNRKLAVRLRAIYGDFGDGLKFDGENTNEGLIQRILWHESFRPSFLPHSGGQYDIENAGDLDVRNYDAVKQLIFADLLGITVVLINRTHFRTGHWDPLNTLRDMSSVLKEFKTESILLTGLEYGEKYMKASGDVQRKMREHHTRIRELSYTAVSGKRLPNPSYLDQTYPALSWGADIISGNYSDFNPYPPYSPAYPEYYIGSIFGTRFYTDPYFVK